MTPTELRLAMAVQRAERHNYPHLASAFANLLRLSLAGMPAKAVSCPFKANYGVSPVSTLADGFEAVESPTLHHSL